MSEDEDNEEEEEEEKARWRYGSSRGGSVRDMISGVILSLCLSLSPNFVLSFSFFSFPLLSFRFSFRLLLLRVRRLSVRRYC